MKRHSTTLTAREAQVMAAIAEGKTYREIARRLGIATNTVGAHVKKARERMRANRPDDLPEPYETWADWNRARQTAR